jgi:tetratricopeptide (TPR) repeat protein
MKTVTIVVLSLLLTPLFCAAIACADPATAPEPLPDMRVPSAELQSPAERINHLCEARRFENARAICQAGLDSATDDETRAFYLRHLALTYDNEGNYDQAIATYGQVIAQYPQSHQAPWARYYMAQMYLFKARLPGQEASLGQAVMLLEQFLKDYPNHYWAGRAMYTLGRCHEQAGDYDAALATWQQGVEQYPKHLLVDGCLTAAIELCTNLGRWDDVIALSQRYIEQFPNQRPAGARLWIPVAHAAKGDKPAALAAFETLMVQHSSPEACFVGWKALTQLIYDQSQHPDATSICQLAIAAAPTGDLAAYAKLMNGDAGRVQWKRHEALPWYQEVAAKHGATPYATPARYWSAWCLTAEHPEQAIPYYQEVIAKDSDQERTADALRGLAMCYGELRDDDQARQAYEQLLARDDEGARRWHPGAYKNIGICYYNQREYALARTQFEGTIARWPGSDVADEAALCLAQIADIERALAPKGGP